MNQGDTGKLLLRARNGDGDAFVELMERHKQSMYKTAKAYLHREEDVADAMAETVLDCFEHLKDLKEPRYFGTWLVRILINNCKNLLRQNGRADSVEDVEGLQREQERDENAQAFLDYLYPLGEEERFIMILFYVWGFRTREIGEILHIKETTVKAKLQRSRGKIKKEFFPRVV